MLLFDRDKPITDIISHIAARSALFVHTVPDQCETQDLSKSNYADRRPR